MPIVFDASKKLIELEILYIEKKKHHGHVLYSFIQNRTEYENLIKKGYKTQAEIEVMKNSLPPSPDVPGAPRPSLNYDPEKIIYRIVTQWKCLTWKDHNSILSQCMKIRTGPDGKQFADYDNMLFNELQVKKCLKNWDLKNENGDPIPVTSDTIDNLPPDLGNELVSAFNQANQLNEEELKN